MKTLFEIEKLLKEKNICDENFFSLDEKKRNYYIGWHEGLDLIKNALEYDKHLAYIYINFMLDCIEKKIDREHCLKNIDFSYGWLDGYLESLKWFLNQSKGTF